MIIMPQGERYDVCDYTYKNLGFGAGISNPLLLTNLQKRTFEVVESFDDLEEARKFMEGTEYVLQYVFKELEEDVS